MKKYSLIVLICFLFFSNSFPFDSSSLINQLSSTNPKIRIWAVTEIAKKRITRAVPILLSLFKKEKNTAVKKAIIFALGKIKDPRAVDLLCKTAGQYFPQGLLEKAMEAMTEWHNKKFVTTLINLLSEMHLPNVTLSAIPALSSMGKFAIPQILSRIKKDNGINSHFLKVLGQIKDRRAVPYILKELSKHKKPGYFYSNRLKVLEKINDKSCFPALSRLFLKSGYDTCGLFGKTMLYFSPSRAKKIFIRTLYSRNKGQSLDSAILLAGLQYRPAFAVLYKYAKYIKNKDFQQAAIYTLGNFKVRGGLPVLINRLLHDKNRVTRAKAAKALGQIADRKAVPALIKALRSPYFPYDKTVHNAAAALCRIRDYRAVLTLMTVSGIKDKWTRSKITEALAAFKDPRSIRVLARLLHDKARYVSITRYAGIGLKRIGKKAADYLRLQLKRNLASGNVKKTIRILTVLGKMRDRNIIPFLLNNIKNIRKEFIPISIILCKKMKVKAAYKYIPQYLTGFNTYIMRKSLEALTVLGGKKALPFLLAKMGHSDSYIRVPVAECLGLIKTGQTTRLLVDMLHDKDFSVRKAAATALSKRRSAYVKKQLLKRLKVEKEIFVRAPLLTALVLQGRKKYTSFILKGAVRKTQDREWYVRALGKIGGRRALNILLPLLKQYTGIQRTGIVVLLGNMGLKKAVPALIKLLHDPYPDVVRRTAEALGKLGDRRALQPLKACLKNNDKIELIEAIEAAIDKLK